MFLKFNFILLEILFFVKKINHSYSDSDNCSMKSYLRFAIYTFVILLLSSCASTKRLVLSEVDSKFRNFEGTDLDPLKNKEREIIVTEKPKYDKFIQESNKVILSLQLAERTIDIYNENKQAGKNISREMEAATYLQESLPNQVSSIAQLIISGQEIEKSIEDDFSGVDKGMIPSVGLEIANILKNFADYSPKTANIISEINRIRSDSSNFAESNNNQIASNDSETASNSDSSGMETSLVERELSGQDTITEKQTETAEPELLPTSDQSNKSKDKSNNFIKKLPSTYGLKIKDPRVPNEEEQLTEEEKQIRAYDQKVKEGLISVFRAESANKPLTLIKIMKNHPIPRIRAASAFALGRIRKGRIDLEKTIDTDGFLVRTAAFKSLADIGDKRSLSYFIAGSKSEDSEIKAASFRGLGKTKDPVGRELILGRGLTSELIIVIAESLRGLAQYKVPADVELINRYLSVDESELQQAAIEALVIHNTPESLKSLEESLDKHPKLTFEILDAIGKSKELAATLFLVRASQIYEDERVIDRVGQLLLKRKAFGRYAMVMEDDQSLRISPNERSTPITFVNKSDVGRLNNSTTKRFIVRVGDELLEDIYHNILVEDKIIGSKERYVSGWLFGKKLQLIAINKPEGKKPAYLKNIQTGKHQNLFEPAIESPSNKIPKK